MASHQLAIAKATFAAGLLRPDPTSLSRDEIAHFHALLTSVLLKCTPINVQKCKEWILKNLIQSTARFAALGKYLSVLTTSLSDNTKLDSKAVRQPSVKRQRLHILYLVNDILYFAKFRSNNASVCAKLQPILMKLVGSAASFTACPKHQRKVEDLLAIFEEKGYYSKEYVAKLHEAASNASKLGVHTEAIDNAAIVADQNTTKSAKVTPFVMPAMHGDQATPWCDLPAGNLMPHIEPNSTRPINPDLIKPLRFVAGPADDSLIVAVKALLGDVQVIFGEEEHQDEKVSYDIDELGQPIILDEITGDVLEGEGYYGWSRGFCEKVKRRRRGIDLPDRDENQRRRSRSSTPDGKRRRYSDSDGSSPRRNARRGYSSSRSSSRSHSPRPGFSRPYSRSRSRTRSPRRSSQSPRVKNVVPPPPPPPEASSTFHSSWPPSNSAANNHFPQPPQPPYNMAQGRAHGWQQSPPPPPPPNYPQSVPQRGQWPPPPPPGPPPPPTYHQPPQHNYQQPNYQQPQYPNPPQGHFQQAPQFPQTQFQQSPYPQSGFPIPPPPPGLPPSNWQQHMPQNGRGYNKQNGWEGGRGDRGRW